MKVIKRYKLPVIRNVERGMCPIMGSRMYLRSPLLHRESFKFKITINIRYKDLTRFTYT